MGIEPRDVGIQANNLALMVGRRPRAELTHLLMCEPLRADGLARVIGQALTSDAAQSPLDVLADISRFNGRLVRLGLVGDPLATKKQAAEKDDALADALRRCGAAEVARDGLTRMPAAVQKSATVILLASVEAAEWVHRSQRGASPEFWQGVAERLRRPLKAEDDPPEPDFDLEFKRVVGEFPTENVMVAAQEVLLAVGYAVETIRADPTLADAMFELRVNTKLGWVVLAGTQADDYRLDGPVLLTIDLGGDDTYTNAGANGGLDYPVSVSLDFGGDDSYRAADDALCSFGAGVFGVGVLWDGGGNDRYEAQRRTQGAAFFGVGVLIDTAGDDTYTAVQGSQGSATAGYAVLIDRTGNDRYESFLESQAFAGPNAAAVLIDLAGDDHYLANDTDIRFPSAQNPQHNNSLCQGAGTGWRADYVDGVSVNGGVAILVDAAGDDEYVCGLFGQGTGYWYGLGMLIDLAGDDRYTGHWYVQGAAAHYAAGMLFDRGGNDRYVANQNMSQGAGHDLSVGVLVDDAGDDVYLATTLGLGASNAAGVGLFIDKAGNDQYQCPPSDCLGWVNPNQSLRGLFASYGLFFDLGGDDVYAPRAEGQPVRAGLGNGRRWTCPPDPNAIVPYLFGFGFDEPQPPAQ